MYKVLKERITLVDVPRTILKYLYGICFPFCCPHVFPKFSNYSLESLINSENAARAQELDLLGLSSVHATRAFHIVLPAIFASCE